MKTTTSLLSLLISSSAISLAPAQQFADDFDSYTPGPITTQTGAWEPWDNDPGAANALVTASQAQSAPHSLQIDASDDLVHRLTTATSGQWVLTANWYVPSGMSGRSFLILMNTYSPGGPYSWSVQLGASGALGTVGDYPDVGQAPAASLPTLVDQWAEVRIYIDLDADTHTVYYGGQFLYSDLWSTHAFPFSGATELSAIDLWSDGSSGAFWDDVSVRRNAGANYCGPAVPNSTGQRGVTWALGSDSAAANDLLLSAHHLPPGQFGYFLASASQGFFMPASSDGFICLSGNIGRFNAPALIIQGPAADIQANLNAIPVNPPVAVQPGDTWNFQCWYRDNNPAQTSNFTDAVSVNFQ
ncbi:MAG: hypothetical protein GY711_13505 [bacterium]|nr:hypothetical protein [bacterium]